MIVGEKISASVAENRARNECFSSVTFKCLIASSCFLICAIEG